MIFLRMKKSVLKGTGKLPNVNLDAPILKRIQMLGQLHDLAKATVEDTKSLIKLFDHEEGALTNLSECFAVSLKLLSASVKQSHVEYHDFLDKQSALYDEVGHLQRKLQYDLSVKVITPLSGWLHADYTRMSSEIQMLYERRSEFDLATLESAKDPQNHELVVHLDLCRREHDRQLEITKFELLRLSGIKNDFAKILSQFTSSFKEFSSGIRKILEKIQAEIQI